MDATLFILKTDQDHRSPAVQDLTISLSILTLLALAVFDWCSLPMVTTMVGTSIYAISSLRRGMKPLSFRSSRSSRPAIVCPRLPSTAARAILAPNTDQLATPLILNSPPTRDLKIPPSPSLCAGRSRPRSRDARLKPVKASGHVAEAGGRRYQDGSEVPGTLEGTEKARSRFGGTWPAAVPSTRENTRRRSQTTQRDLQRWPRGDEAPGRTVYTRIRWWSRCKSGFDIILRCDVRF